MIRGIVKAALIIASTHIAVALGQDIGQGKKVPLGASIFYVLMAGGSEEYTPGYWVTRFEREALTLDEDRKLWEYAVRARAENLEFQYAEQEKVCVAKDSLTSIDAVAAALSGFDARNEENIEAIGNETAKALGDRLGNLLMSAASKSTTTIVVTDHKKVMETKKRDPAVYIRAFCSK